MTLDPDQLAPDSWVVTAGRPHRPGDPLNVPIMPASNFLLGGERAYSREHGTDTVDALEEVIGGLEGGRAVAFGSGMAATLAVLESVPPGGSVVIPDDCYQGATGLARAGSEKGRWSVTELATTDTAAWIRAVGQADLVWLESVSNPLLSVADLPAICAAPRKRGNLIAVDNTLPTPFGVRPIQHGADLAVHSASKFIGGHSDLLLGVVVAADPDLASRVRHARAMQGGTPGALEAYLALRGARTLALRVERGQSNAGILAERLSGHPEVTLVRYPALSSHPTRSVAERVLRGAGAMVSFEVKGTVERAERICASVRLIHHATSLGGVESTIERRARWPGQGHLPPTLLRMSVGCENVEDLWRDLEEALSATAGRA